MTKGSDTKKSKLDAISHTSTGFPRVYVEPEGKPISIATKKCIKLTHTHIQYGAYTLICYAHIWA